VLSYSNTYINSAKEANFTFLISNLGDEGFALFAEKEIIFEEHFFFRLNPENEPLWENVEHRIFTMDELIDHWLMRFIAVVEGS